MYSTMVGLPGFPQEGHTGGVRSWPSLALHWHKPGLSTYGGNRPEIPIHARATRPALCVLSTYIHLAQAISADQPYFNHYNGF
jgi:hypothetical protein